MPTRYMSNGPSRFTQYGGVAGADLALKQLVAERLAAQMEAEKQQQAQQQLHIENQMRQRQLSQGDERIGLEREGLRLQAQPRPPSPVTLSPGQRLVNPAGGGTIAEVPDRPEKPAGPMNLSPGSVLVDPATGRLIYRNPQATPQAASGVKPNDVTEAYSDERSTRLKDSLDAMEAKIGEWTTGWGNFFFGKMPETDALNFESELDSLKANVAFKELTEMRAASKTGGALGQVSNIELQLLQSALGALNPRQSAANLRAQFQKIRGSLERWERAKAQQQGQQPYGPPEANSGGVTIRSIRQVR